MAFNTPTRCNATVKILSDNLSSTYSFQPKAVPDPNSKTMGTGSEVPWLMTRLGIEEANKAQDTSVLQRQMESHTRPSDGGKYLSETFRKWAWVSYQRFMRGAYSLSGSQHPSCSLECSDSE